jgi:hypothetical protein
VKAQLDAVNQFLAANPKIKNILDGAVKAAEGGVIIYISPFISSLVANPAQAATVLHGLSLTGAGIAIGGNLKAYLQHQQDIQNLLKQITPGGQS